MLLALSNAKSPSVIQVRAQDITPGHLSKIIVDALRQYEPLLEAGALIILDEVKLRARVLPLRK